MSDITPQQGSETPSDSNDTENANELYRLICGFQVSRIIRLVADNGIANDIPLNGRVAVADLAAKRGLLPGALLRLCRALAAYGIFDVSPDGSIGHSAKSRLLRSDAKPSLGLWARFKIAPGSWGAWGALDEALRPDRAPYDAVWGMHRFDYLRAHPEEGLLRDAFMASAPGNRHSAVAAAYNFSDATSVMDVGGGNGALLTEILSRYPGPRGVVFDREEVVAGISPRQDGRLQVQAGDFFQGVTGGADVHILSWILHDWPDRDCLRILQNCRQVIPSNGRLLIVERALDPDPARGDPMSYLADIEMMVLGGQERTPSEFERLLRSAGFELIKTYPTSSPVAVFEAKPV